jgi:hypothetical protein
MKASAYIFTLLTLFFVAQPYIVRCQQDLIAANEAKQAECCSRSCDKKQATENPQTKDCDKTNSCNPFAGCSGCQYLPTTRFQYKSLAAAADKLRSPSFSENTAAGFITNCWNPPEMSAC